MRRLPLLILVPTLVLTSCGKKDLETEAEPIPAPAPAPVTTAPPPELPNPGANNPFRVPDATGKLPEAKDTRATNIPPVAPTPAGNDTATVTVRPPAEVPPANGNTE